MKFLIQLIIYSLIFCSEIVSAEEKILDNFRVALGGYFITEYESSVSLTEPKLGTGVSISPNELLGLDARQNVFRLDGYYRFNKEHGFSYSWYKINTNSSKILEEEFTWIDQDGNDITIPIGAQVSSVLDYSIFKIGYLWSFYHSKKIELSAGAGLHITRLSLGISARTTSSGLDARDVKVTAPLPVLTIGMKYNVTPKFSWHIKSEVFSISFDEFDGSYIDTIFGVEYLAWNNVGIGIGLGSNSLTLTQRTSDYKLRYANQITGVNAYLAVYF